MPIAEVNSLAELNDHLAVACITDLRRTIRGRQQAVGEALDLLRPLSVDAFATCEHATPRVAQQVVDDWAAEPAFAAGLPSWALSCSPCEAS
jgi:hypothetical protein